MKISLNHIEQDLILEIKGDPDSINEISEDMALEFAESRYQIMEGCIYEYRFKSAPATTNDFGLFQEAGNKIISVSKFEKSRGRLTPNIYVGSLGLGIVRNTEPNRILDTVYLEVLATKLGDSIPPEYDKDYRENYKSMLEDIASKCSDLLIQINSPVSQKFEPDFNVETRTIYQRFAFVKSLIASVEFNNAVNRILYAPAARWKETLENEDIRKMRRVTSSASKQIISGTNRINYDLAENIHSVPLKILNNHKNETFDTPENRFIKFSLGTFLNFCEVCEKKFSDLNYEKACKEAGALNKVLLSYLEAPFFKEISRPTTLQLNSPLLQRKSGYREILNAWMLFDLAAKLIWKGGENIYHADKRDIAVLYEYWLFFQLYDLFITKFEFRQITYDNSLVSSLIDREQIEETKDGLGLKLKSGKETSLSGKTRNETRNLNVRFSYNRTYSGNSKYIGNKELYHAKQGSWTKQLRPDYTLSFWPSALDEDDAEAEDVIVHIHFDAKYKLKWQEVFTKKLSEAEDDNHQEGSSEKTEAEDNEENDESGDKLDSLEKEKRDERNGIYKNADLLKMHAYKDAIRRTGGAYVLYPGEGDPEKTNAKYLGFHEVIPGLGAFAICPSKDKSRTGISELSEFIDKVIAHLQDRASQRENLAYKAYDIHKAKKSDYKKDGKTPNITNEPMPEYLDTSQKVKLIPDETYVLIGYYKSQEHLNWIVKHGVYNGRTGNARGAMNITSNIIGAQYLLLHTKGNDKSGKLFKIKQCLNEKPRILSVDDKIFIDYPSPKHNFYLIFTLEKAENEFHDQNWYFRDLTSYTDDNEAFPVVCTLTELMAVLAR